MECKLTILIDKGGREREGNAVEMQPITTVHIVPPSIPELLLTFYCTEPIFYLGLVLATPQAY